MQLLLIPHKASPIIFAVAAILHVHAHVRVSSEWVWASHLISDMIILGDVEVVKRWSMITSVHDEGEHIIIGRILCCMTKSSKRVELPIDKPCPAQGNILPLQLVHRSMPGQEVDDRPMVCLVHRIVDSLASLHVDALVPNMKLPPLSVKQVRVILVVYGLFVEVLTVPVDGCYCAGQVVGLPDEYWYSCKSSSHYLVLFLVVGVVYADLVPFSWEG